MNGNQLLTFKGICKEYPGVRALKDVEFAIDRSEIHGLVGENGAGKSTLLKIVAGDIVDYRGDLILDGKKAAFKSQHDAMEAGISVVYQELSLCGKLSVTQNIYLGRELRKRNHSADWQLMTKRSREHVGSLGLDIDVSASVQKFNTAQQQIIEIARATAFESKVIILDEPTSALNQVEVARLFGLLKNLRSKGVTIVFVSHRIHEVLQLTDRVSVLRNGEYIDTVSTAQVGERDIVQLMIGQDMMQRGKAVTIPLTAQSALTVSKLSRNGAFSDISFSVMKGEIVGVAGLEGSGRFSMARALFGLLPHDGGRILLEEREVKISKPFDAIRHGIGFISRDRKGEGIFGLMDLVRNITMVCTLGDRLVRNKKNVEVAKRFIKKLRIVCASAKQNISSLSGGNQQKSIVSRWLAENPKLIIMEEPTHGIDVGAKAEMFEIIRDLAKSGTSVLIISSELEELLNECHRVLVMRNGTIRGELVSANTDQHEIMSLATGIQESSLNQQNA